METLRPISLRQSLGQCRNVSTRVQDAPNFDPIIARDVEDRVGETLQVPNPEVRDVQHERQPEGAGERVPR